MSVWALERIRLEAEVAEAAAGLAQAQERLRARLAEQSLGEMRAEASSRAARYDEGISVRGLTVRTLEGGRIDRAAAEDEASVALVGLRAAVIAAEAAVQAAEAVFAGATRGLERYRRQQERRVEGRRFRAQR